MQKRGFAPFFIPVLFALAAQASAIELNVNSIGSGVGQRVDGAAAADALGLAVDYVGDLNNDGFDDMAIGVPGRDRGGNSIAGAVNIYYGSASGSISAPNVQILGALGAISLGGAVAPAGDFNGDGFDDLIIANPNGGGAAIVYLIYGKANLPSVIDLNDPPGDFGFGYFGDNTLGWSMSSGNFNNDGFSDLLISEFDASEGPRALVIFGQAAALSGVQSLTGLNATTTPRVVFFYGDEGSRFGYSVRGIKDFNGDLIDDMLIGSPLADNGNGRAHVIFGRNNTPQGALSFTSAELLSGFDSTKGLQFTAANSPALGSAQLGAAVASGDLNGDGAADLLIGAPLASGTNGTQSGAAYIVYRPSSIGATAYSRAIVDVISAGGGFTVSGATTLDNAGFSISGPGDLNRDGLGDMVVGAPNALSGIGRFYVIYGRPVTNPYSPTATLNLLSLADSDGVIWRGIGGATAPADQTGYSMSQRGDFNGDGRADLAIGAPRVDGASGANSGAVFVLYRDALRFCSGFENNDGCR